MLSWDARKVAQAALDAARQFDDTRECSCEEGLGACWYHLSQAEQSEERIAYIASAVHTELVDQEVNRMRLFRVDL